MSVFPLHLPPLRERPEDIEALTRHFLAQFAAKSGNDFRASDGDIRLLKSYSYPGNVRELRNVVERAVILGSAGKINVTLPSETREISETNTEQKEKDVIYTFEELKELERNSIIQTLKQTKYKVYGKGGAAEALGSKPTTLISKIKSMQIPMRPVD